MRYHAAPAPLPEPTATTTVTLTHYTPQTLHEQRLSSIDELRTWIGRPGVLWLDIEGRSDAPLIHRIGELFELHPLAIEDVLHLNQRPKLEQYATHDFIVSRMVRLAEELETEQLGLFLGPSFVVTFQQGAPGDCFEPVRARLRASAGRVRQCGPDALAYALLDSVTDAYFPVLEQIGERLDTLEDDILAAPGRRMFQRVHDFKRQLFTLRRAVWPMRDALNALAREPLPRISEETRLYLRDCHDHALRIIDLVETYREYCADLMDLYVSATSQRMNEVMKLLTIISTIFIPLTFVSSIYGMNFDPDSSPWNMPELRAWWGYPTALLAMLLIALALLLYFWRRGWLRNSELSRPRDEPL